MKSAIRHLNIYLPEKDYKAFIEAFQGTTYQSMTAYARNLILGKPVRVLCRNRSLDDFIELGVKMRKELRLLLTKDLLTVEEKEDLMRRVGQIEEYLINIVEICRQK